MYLHLQERPRSEPTAAILERTDLMATVRPSLYAPLYERLANHIPTLQERESAADLLRRTLQDVATQEDDLPEHPADLTAWMEANIQKVHGLYQAYLDERKAGSPRCYFTNRAHALYFLRNIAPTKLVDGSWLYGLCQHAENSRFSDLVTTYVEELGDGLADKNHVKLYRALLATCVFRSLLDSGDELSWTVGTAGAGHSGRRSWSFPDRVRKHLCSFVLSPSWVIRGAGATG